MKNKNMVAENPTLPYSKPTLTKHKPLRDITAQAGSIPVT